MKHRPDTHYTHDTPPARPLLVGIVVVAATAALVLFTLVRATPPGDSSDAFGSPPPATQQHAGSFIDHSAVDRDNLAPEPNPSPLSVAAYGT